MSHFLSFQKDPVPPELLLLLQQSQDPLLQQLFPVTAESPQTNQNDFKTQTKPVVATVVSKFKVCLVMRFKSIWILGNAPGLILNQPLC